MARTSVANWFATETTSVVEAGSLSVDVTSTGDLTAPTYIVFRPRDAANREVWRPSSLTATSFTVASLDDRHLAGSAAVSGQGHPVGTEVWSVPLSQHLDDLWDEVDGKASTDYVDAAIPVGGIILWSGAVANIPDSWALCDGTGGTPDLRGRFVVGAGDAYAVADTGGAETVALTEAELPAHTHAAGTLAADSGGAHQHDLDHQSDSGTPVSDTLAVATAVPNANDTLFSGSAGAHTHAVTGSTGSTGSGDAHENRPPYYALAYIQRIA